MKLSHTGALLFLLGTGVLLPFVYLPGLADPSFALQLAALCVLCLLYTFFSWRTLRDTFTRMPLLPLISLGGFLLWSAVSLAGALSPAEGFLNLLRTGILLSFFLVATDFFRQGKNNLLLLARGLSAAAALLCFLGLVQLMLKQDASVNLPPTGTQGNRNFFAEALLLLSPFVLIAAAGTISRERWAHVAVLILVLLLCGLAKTRSVWLALFVFLFAGVVIMALFAPRSLTGRYASLLKTKWLLPVALLLLLAGMGAGWKYRKQSGLSLLTAKEIPPITDSMGSTGERVILWRHTAHEIASNPLTGVGAGQWKLIIGRDGVRGYNAGYATRYYTSAHNDFLQAAAETGLPGLLLWLLLPLYALVAGIRAIRKAASVGEVLARVFLTAGICGWAVISFFGFPNERMLTAALFLCLCAAMPPAAKHRTVRLQPFMMAAIVLLFSAAGLIYTILRISSESHVVKMLDANLGRKWGIVLREGSKAESTLFRYDYVSATPITWYKGVAKFSQQDYAGALSLLQQAHALSPYHPQVLNAAGSAAGMAGDLAAAEQYYAESLKCFPDFEEAAANLGDVLIYQQKYAAAAEMLAHQYKGVESERIRTLRIKAAAQGQPIVP